MPSYKEQLAGIAPWRRTVTIVLLVVALVLLVLAVAGVIHTAAIIGAVVIVALSLLIGPRSPFFRSDQG
ncbi:MAG: hypothetical protein U0W40_01225 [Acidimicrobiia bacterium]